MKLTIAAIGRLKPSPEQALLDKYHTRLPWSCEWVQRHHQSNQPTQIRMQHEAQWLIKQTHDTDLRIALDGRGQSLSSDALAKQIGQWQQRGVVHLGLCIGGQDGLDESVRAASGFIWALGPQTWPHMLVRALLMEQLYRAHTILTGHPYHRGNE